MSAHKALMVATTRRAYIPGPLDRTPDPTVGERPDFDDYEDRNYPEGIEWQDAAREVTR